MMVKRRAPHPARGGLLPVREVVGVEQAQRLFRALEKVCLVPLKRLHAGDIHIAQIERLFAAVHPLRQRHARATRRLYTDGIEAGGDPDVVHFWRKAKVIGIVRGKAFGAVEEGMYPCLGQHRHPIDGVFEDRFEVIEILGQLVEFEILGDAVYGPGFGVGLKRAQQHLARVFLVIGTFIGHPQDGQLGQSGDRLGHDVEMLAGVQRDIHAGHAAHLMTPHARAVHDHVAGHGAGCLALRPVHRSHAAPRPGDTRDLGAFRHDSAPHPRALCQRMGDIGRIALPIQRQVNPCLHIVGVQVFVARLHLGG